MLTFSGPVTDLPFANFPPRVLNTTRDGGWWGEGEAGAFCKHLSVTLLNSEFVPYRKSQTSYSKSR